MTGAGVILCRASLAPEGRLACQTAPLHELDAAFADHGEDVEQVGEAEQVANLLVEVHQLQAATGGLSRHVKPHQRAQSHAVRVLQVGEVEDDSLELRDQRGDFAAEHLGDARDQPAVAVHDHRVAAGTAFHFKPEDRCNGGVGHRDLLVKRRVECGPGWSAGWSDCRIQRLVEEVESGLLLACRGRSRWREHRRERRKRRHPPGKAFPVRPRHLIVTLAEGRMSMPLPVSAFTVTFSPVTSASLMVMPLAPLRSTFFSTTPFTGDSGSPMITPSVPLLMALTFSITMSWKNGVSRVMGSAGLGSGGSTRG